MSQSEMTIRRPAIDPRSATVPVLRSALDQWRLENGWSYPYLAGLMDMPHSTIVHFVKYADRQPFATTVYKVRKYLARVIAEGR
jgi:hypothetical protein